MGTRTSYAPGTFSWVDLATTDAEAAKRFYGGLLGWQMEDRDAGGGAVYTMCRVGADDVSGIFAMPGDSAAWTGYVTVDDADATAARAAELGGAVVRGPFDVLDAGRMAMLADPQGAAFAVWQPRARIGAMRVNDVGCLCMNELATSDAEAARAFYEPLFGWTMEQEDTMGFARNGGDLTASFFPAEEGLPPHWRPCFTVESTETAVARVRVLGGSVVIEAFELPDGSVALARDPQGAIFSLFAGETDP
jgi:predicted enzyme related to lactoylglutathione lyase